LLNDGLDLAVFSLLGIEGGNFDFIIGAVVGYGFGTFYLLG
jgi:hypothetical protein